MALSESPNVDASSCSLCHAPLDTGADDACSAIAAIAFSQSLSSKPGASASENLGHGDMIQNCTNGSCCKEGEEEKKSECCGEGDGSCRTSQKRTR